MAAIFEGQNVFFVGVEAAELKRVRKLLQDFGGKADFMLNDKVNPFVNLKIEREKEKENRSMRREGGRKGVRGERSLRFIGLRLLFRTLPFRYQFHMPDDDVLTCSLALDDISGGSADRGREPLGQD